MFGTLPNGIKPYGYQERFAFQIITQKGAILSLDVGMGKTIVDIMVALVFQNMVKDAKIVVLAPPSLLENWRREFSGMANDLILVSHGKPYQKINGDYLLIVDEAHKFQNIHSKRTRQALLMARKAKMVIPTTATPIRNYPSNLFPLLAMIRHPLSRSWKIYKNTYCAGKMNGAQNLDSLYKEVGDYIILGTKEQYLNVPKLERKLLHVRFTGKIKQVFDDTLATLRKIYQKRIQDGKISNRGHHLVSINQLRQASALAKIPYAVKLAKSHLRYDKQVIIFTQFTNVCEFLKRKLSEYNPQVLTGAIPKNKRQLLADTFQNGKSKVFIGSSAAGVGLNLYSGCVVILMDRSWSPMDAIQMEGRAHRIGQKNEVTVYWLQDTVIDKRIDTLLVKKFGEIARVLTGKWAILEGIDTPGSYADEIARLVFGTDVL